MISIHKYSLKVVAVASFCSYSLCSSAQQLQAGNIDEVVKAMALEEKCHFVLGCGMHFNDEAKFLVQRAARSAWSDWVSPRPIAPTLSRAFV